MENFKKIQLESLMKNRFSKDEEIRKQSTKELYSLINEEKELQNLLIEKYGSIKILNERLLVISMPENFNIKQFEEMKIVMRIKLENKTIENNWFFPNDEDPLNNFIGIKDQRINLDNSLRVKKQGSPGKSTDIEQPSLLLTEKHCYLNLSEGKSIKEDNKFIFDSIYSKSIINYMENSIVPLKKTTVSISNNHKNKIIKTSKINKLFIIRTNRIMKKNELMKIEKENNIKKKFVENENDIFKKLDKDQIIYGIPKSQYFKICDYLKKNYENNNYSYKQLNEILKQIDLMDQYKNPKKQFSKRNNQKNSQNYSKCNFDESLRTPKTNLYY